MLHEMKCGDGKKTLVAKLADFGLSKDIDWSHPKTKAGTLTYMAPEVGQQQSMQQWHALSAIPLRHWQCMYALYHTVWTNADQMHSCVHVIVGA